MNALTAKVLEIARGYIGVHEEGGNNRGPQVEKWLRMAGGHPGEPWCAAFVSACFAEAAGALGVDNPMEPCRGALRCWHIAPPGTKSKTPAPGSIFVIDHGGGLGHVGLVESVTGDHVVTIEGNTDGSGGREGVEVASRIRRFAAINVGYIDYGRDVGAVPQGIT